MRSLSRTTLSASRRSRPESSPPRDARSARESLIIIIHKTLPRESARRETKQERCAAKQGALDLVLAPPPPPPVTPSDSLVGSLRHYPRVLSNTVHTSIFRPPPTLPQTPLYGNGKPRTRRRRDEAQAKGMRRARLSRAETQSLPASAPIRAPRR